MPAYNVKQGDAFLLPVTVLLNGEGVDIHSVEAAEFTLGRVRKTYPGEVTYDQGEGCFQVPLSQKDTFSLPPDDGVPFDVRVKFNGGTVLGTRRMPVFAAADALSQTVI